MATSVTLALLAAATGGAAQAPVHIPTRAVAPAYATARILSGAKVRLGAGTQPEGYRSRSAVVTVEDGSRRSAQLVEFQ